MSTPIQASFAVKGWDENTWDGKNFREVTGAKLTHAVVKYAYEGGIQAESTVHFLMSYVGDGTYGSYVALEEVKGSLDGKSGTYVLQHTGTFDKDGVQGKTTVVPDSATGELAGLEGSGSYDLAGHQESYPMQFAYNLT